MAGKIRLFEQINGLLVEVHPDLAEQSKRGRRCSVVHLAVEVLWTPEEEAQRDAEEAQAAKEKAAAIASKETARANKEAALGKLKALGLSDAEIAAIMPK